jgi:tetratricopeptide (TPR) repeat protein
MKLTVQPDLERLENAELIRRAWPTTEPEYSFKHGLVQETAYDSLLKQDRRRLHAFVAQVLEGVSSGNGEQMAPMLALHWDEAGEPQRAFGYYLQAGDAAARVYANAEALMAYTRAAALVPEILVDSEQIRRLYGNRGRVCELGGNYDAALKTYEELEAWGRANNDPAVELDALIRRATLYVTPNKFYDSDKGFEVLDRALQLARAARDRPAEAKVLWNRMLINTFVGHVEQALYDGEASLAIARELDLREQTAYTLNDLVRAYAFAQRFNEARQAHIEAEALWRELENLPMLADNLTNWGAFAFFSGKVQESIPRVREALRISQEINNLWGQAYAGETLGYINLTLGETREALSYLLHAAELGAQVNFLDPEYNGRAFAGLVYLELGATQPGIALLEPLTARTGIAGEWILMATAVLAMHYCEAGDLEGARLKLAQADSLFHEELDFTSTFIYTCARTHYYLAIGEAELAHAQAVQLPRILQDSGVQVFVPFALYYQGRALEALNNRDEALQVFKAGFLECEKSESMSLRWALLAGLARLTRAAGDLPAAREWQAMGRQAAIFTAEHAPSELRSNFLNRAEVRPLFLD